MNNPTQENSMTKDAPGFAHTFCEQLSRSLGFASMEELAKIITLGRAVQDFVGKLSPESGRALRQPQFAKIMDGDKHVMTADHVNSLAWDVSDFGGRRMTFEEAQKACAELRTGGHSDWRLPTIQELLTLVDYERAEPACDPEFFPNASTDYYYRTSTPYTPGSGCAWGVFFGGGYSYGLRHGSDYCVRAVRASQS